MNTGNTNRRLALGVSAKRLLFASYQRRAKRDGLTWRFTLLGFLHLTQGNCDYCGKEPSQVYLPNKDTFGAYVYNGIDRVDSLKGYTWDNCVPCCYTCNVAKASMTRSQFIDWVRRVYAKIAS